MLSTPVLAILRSYGIGMNNFGTPAHLHFRNNKGLERVVLPFNEEVENLMGIKGWFYGILRSTGFKLMLDKLPSDFIYTDHKFASYTEVDDEVHIDFENGARVTADILVGADGIKSRVSEQAFGDLGLFHTNTRVWLSTCDYFDGIPPGVSYLHHSWQYQASFFPMFNNGKNGFEWWVVEPSYEGKPQPDDPKKHIKAILEDFSDPMGQFPDHTDFAKDTFCWEVYNRASLKKWSKGRVVCIGDSVHPVSPYAAYGMGMAIEDGYYIARALDGVNLGDQEAVTSGFTEFEHGRVAYVNKNVEFARSLGTMFHRAYWPVAKARDLIFDRTPFLANQLKQGYLESAEAECMSMKELHVKRASV